MSEHIAPDGTIPHGEAIVERFGGIRPMASKLNVAVTTVQGWKKRDAIPLDRRDAIVAAAALHGVNLKGLIKSSVANENGRTQQAESVGIEEDPALRAYTETPQKPQPAFEGIDLHAVQRSARNTSLVVSGALGVFILGAGFLLFGNSAAPKRISALEARMGVVEARESATGAGAITAIQQDLNTFKTTFAQRLNVLEQQLKAGGAAPLAGMAQNLQNMVQTPQGQMDWQAAMTELRGLVTGLQGRTDGLEQALSAARVDQDALGRTLSDVSARDVQAAAMLMALTQLRDTTSRETPFADDLALLREVAQNSDPALLASIDALAPYAASGVLSPSGLKRELLASASDIIAAKARGENVSIKDRIIARFQSLFSIKKDGMPVMAGGERAVIEQAASQLDTGNVAGAIDILKQIEGANGVATQGWQNKAQATLLVQQLDQKLVGSLIQKIKNGLSGTAAPINLSPVVSAPAPQTSVPEAVVPITPDDVIDQAEPSVTISQ
jgi:hypothetical protein